MVHGKFYQINQYIRAEKVRVIGKEGKQLGVMPLTQALQEASKTGLDLVEVAPQAQPPVCKIIDFKKFIYQEKKKKGIGGSKRKRQPELKQIRLKIFIEEHDLQRRIKNAQTFLKGGNKVRFIIILRGREITKKELAYDLLKRIKEALAGVAQISKEVQFKGRNLEMTVRPIKNAKKENQKISS